MELIQFFWYLICVDQTVRNCNNTSTDAIEYTRENDKNNVSFCSSQQTSFTALNDMKCIILTTTFMSDKIKYYQILHSPPAIEIIPLISF